MLYFFSFLDREFSSLSQQWNISSPQHIDGYSLSRLFPADFFDFGFAVTREPAVRFLSAFKFQIFEKRIAQNQDISSFIKNELRKLPNQLGEFDNHFLPQTKLLIPDMEYQIFKLENGLDNVKQFIDSRLLEANTKENIQRHNIEPSMESLNPTQFTIDKEAMDIIREVYREDFSMLQY